MSACVAVTSTSRSPAPSACAWDDELPEDRRDAALDRLEGLAGDALVRRAQPPSERDDELRGDVRVLAQQAPHVRPADRERLHLVERLDGRRSPLVVEHGKLAEDVTRTEVREGDRAAVGIRADGAGMTGAHDVARVAVVALAEDDLMGREATGHGDGGDVAQVAGRQGLEDRHAREQPRSDILRPHRLRMPQPQPRPAAGVLA